MTTAVNIALNDHDIHTVARNILIIMIFFGTQDPEEAAEHAIHLWYSTLITQKTLDALHDEPLSYIRHVIEDSFKEIGISTENGELEEEFEDHVVTAPLDCPQVKSTLFVEIRAKMWHILRSFCFPSETYDAKAATESRMAGIQDIEHEDFRERRYLFMITQPWDRVCANKYLEDGMLLPFGAPRDEFTIVNP